MRSILRPFRRSSPVAPTDDSDAASKVVELEELSARGSAGGKKILTIEDEGAAKLLAHGFTKSKKWTILTVIFLVQISMNFNASVYANSVTGMMEEFDVSRSRAMLGQLLFLVTYAFGCEAWAPWSEEIGRKSVLQGSLLLVNIWQLPAALSENVATVIVARCLGGLSSAGGSVTLSLIPDMVHKADQQIPLAFIVFSSCAGSVVGAIGGGIIEAFLPWRYIFWVQLIFGAIVQLMHLFMVPETNPEALLDREAKRRREDGIQPDIYGPREVHGSLWQRMTFKKTCTLMWRPYRMLCTEPIVGFLSLLSGFADALIFSGLSSFGMVLQQWNFSILEIGLSFIALLVGYSLASASYWYWYRRDGAALKKNPTAFKPERRLWWLLFLVPLLPIGLLGFGFSSLGPPIPWIVVLIFAALIGIANLAIYMATIDYMIAAYGSKYSASATGGNGFCRDFLAGLAAIYTTPLYTNIKTGTKWQLVIPSLLLAGISALLCIPVFVFYVHGSWFRSHSKYAREVAEENEQHGVNVVPADSDAAKTGPEQTGDVVVEAIAA
ncbi:MFS multidrug transporter like protein [Zymoseptoria brevis]|uniref:MFS multidrug transporter like protein n=1 Tax=Zymoseptoria brevis TaxID=1047168 RepID=A0A0F4GID1_9PEZI|nr:MFS multidrug transporter like protein [Zymoseptoria brevis]